MVLCLHGTCYHRLRCSRMCRYFRKKHSNILEAEKAVLIDKVTSLDARIDSLKSLVPETVQKKFLYTVRHGDSFWRISYKLYGTGTRAAEIADINGLTVNYSLHPGDTLSIE